MTIVNNGSINICLSRRVVGLKSLILNLTVLMLISGALSQDVTVLNCSRNDCGSNLGQNTSDPSAVC
jgi:hypothetical protein